jgi:superfamily I DNA/RNA helicase/RecB family exonuclease
MLSLLAIYPTAHKVEDLLKRQSRRTGCILGYRLTTFPQVTDALWREASVLRVIVGSIGERLALEEAITRVRALGSDLPFVPGAGLREHLLAFIHELKSAAIEASDLADACAALPDNLARRLGAVAEIFAQYDNLLRDRGAADTHDRERLVVEWLHRIERNGQRPRFLNGIERLLVAEVYDPSLLQFMLVSSLIRLVGDATLTVQAEAFDLRVNRFAELTWNRFVGDESIVDKVLPDFVRRDGRQGRLGYLLTHLFASLSPGQDKQHKAAFASAAPESGSQESANGVEIPPPDGSVRIIEAANPRREAEEVARAVRRMLELSPSEQTALDRIAIVARNIAGFSHHLQAAFDAYRVPLRLFRNQALSGFAPARVVRDLLRIPLRNYHRDSLLSLCRAPFLKLAAARYRDMLELAGYIDQQTRPLRECIDSRRAELLRTLNSKPRTVGLQSLGHQLTDFDRAAQAWSDLMALLATLEPPATIADYVDRLLGVLDRLGFDPVRDSLADSAAAAAGPLKSALETLATEAALMVPRRQVTLSEFAAVVEDVLDETRIEPLDEQLTGGVRAMSVTDARGLDFDWVFIIGLNDGIFPAYLSEDSLIPDEAIRHLNPLLRKALRKRMGSFAPDAPGPILRTHHDRNAQEAFLFFLAMSMPAQSVVLSYALEDGSGSVLQVSPFVREVSSILKDSLPECAGADEFIPRATDCFAPSEFLARAALDSVLSQPQASHVADVAQIASILRRTKIERRRAEYLALPTRQELVRQLRRRQSSTGDADWLAIDLSADSEKLAGVSAYDGRLTATPALSRFLLKGPRQGPREWSAAQLTELAACGYKFFARRVLRLRQSDDADHEQTALETGNLVHEILERIFTLAPPSDPDSLLETTRQVLADFHAWKRAEARDPAFYEIEWRSIEDMVNEAIQYEIERQHRGEAPTEMLHEFRFSSVLQTASGLAGGLEIALVGQIDRLEIYRRAGRIQRLKVIDYKASRRLSDYAERLKAPFFACEDLQMPVYALGAAEHLRNELSRRATIEVSYIALKSRDKETAPQAIPLALLAGSENDGRRTVATRIRDLVASALAGRFDVDPLECSDYCPYRPVCRFRKPVFDS